MLPLETLLPTETRDLENGLALVPRLKLMLTIHPVVPSVMKALDEWQVKRALIDFFKTSVSPPVALPEGDIVIRRLKDLKKRKRDEPVAHGSLFVRDLGFLDGKKNGKTSKGDGNIMSDVKVSEKMFLDWRSYLVGKMDGIELNLEGVKYKLSVAVPLPDDFERMKRDWEESYAFGDRGFSRGGRQEPDTIVIRGVPSRWFAEPRVSWKPSLLVTHTIFSTFGKIRNLNVAEDDDLGKDDDEDDKELVSGLYCKIVVQFEKHRDFYNTMKVFCGRSLQKQGSRLKADYEVTWDKDGFFRNTTGQTQEKSSSRVSAHEGSRYRSGYSRHGSSISVADFTSDDHPRKRFRD